MANDPKNPLPGELSIDASELKDVMIDLPPRAMQGLRREQDGFEAVIAEIVANQAQFGGRAGITDEDFHKFLANNDYIARIRKFRGPIAKLAEILEETEAVFDDNRHKQISTFATSIDQRAKERGNDDLVARYQLLREYRSATALKAVKTRQKNVRKDNEGPPSDQPGDAAAVAAVK